VIAAELGKPETTTERREALLSGEAEPVVVKNGQPAMLPETIKRLMRAPDPLLPRYQGLMQRKGLMATVVLLGRLDTKRHECAYVRDRVCKQQAVTLSWLKPALSDRP
jgi:hypothetical protein